MIGARWSVRRQRRVAFTAPTEAARSSRPGKGGQWVNQIGSLAGAQPKGLINKPTVPLFTPFNLAVHRACYLGRIQPLHLRVKEYVLLHEPVSYFGLTLCAATVQDTETLYVACSTVAELAAAHLPLMDQVSEPFEKYPCHCAPPTRHCAFAPRPRVWQGRGLDVLFADVEGFEYGHFSVFTHENTRTHTHTPKETLRVLVYISSSSCLYPISMKCSLDLNSCLYVASALPSCPCLHECDVASDTGRSRTASSATMATR